MANIETAPDHSGDEGEIRAGIGDGEKSAQEYRNESLRGHQEAKDALERELMEWEDVYKKRQAEGMTDKQRKEYEKKIAELKKRIVMAAKEKSEVAKAFEESEEKAA